MSAIDRAFIRAYQSDDAPAEAATAALPAAGRARAQAAPHFRIPAGSAQASNRRQPRSPRLLSVVRCRRSHPRLPWKPGFTLAWRSTDFVGPKSPKSCANGTRLGGVIWSSR